MKELTEEQTDFLDRVVHGVWTINPENGLIDVDGSVYIFHHNTPVKTSLPVSFGRVTSNFDCCGCGLKSLKGSTHWVGGIFDCSSNYLTNLRYAPDYVGYLMKVNRNDLSELKWKPNEMKFELTINLNEVLVKNYHIIIPEIESLLEEGVTLTMPYILYYPYRDAYYNSKLSEIL